MKILNFTLFISLFIFPQSGFSMGWYIVKECTAIRPISLIRSFIHQEGFEFDPTHNLELHGPNNESVIVKNKLFEEQNWRTEDLFFTITYTNIDYISKYNGPSPNGQYGQEKSTFTAHVTVTFSSEQDFSEEEKMLNMPLKGKSFETDMQCYFDSQTV